MAKHLAKRLTSAALSAAVFASLLPTAMASEVTDEALIAELQSYSDEYPDGGFAFRESQLEAAEDDGSLYIDIVRMGGTSGDASVTFKAIDFSAIYGEDYTMSVGEGFLLTRELEQEMGAEPLIGMIEGASEDVILGEQAEEAEPENVVEIGVSEDGIVGVNEDLAEGVETEDAGEETAEVVSESAEESAVEDAETELTEESPEGDTVYTFETEEDSGTGLKAAKEAYTGKKSDRRSWHDLVEAPNADAAALAETMQETNGYTGEFAEQMPGTSCTLEFADGEYMKRVKIDIIDDDIAESEEQVLFFLTDAVGGELAQPATAYLNIVDNEESERAVFSLPEGTVTVTPGEGYAEVTVERISGIESFASVTLATGAITAEPDKDYQSGRAEVVFPQGVTTRTVKIPIYDMARNESVTFAVAIDEETAFADEDTSSATVIIVPTAAVPASDDGSTSVTWYDASSDTSDGDAAVELYALDANQEAVSIKTKRATSTSSGTGWGGKASLATNIDLRNAQSVAITYSSGGGYKESYTVTVQDGCDSRQETRQRDTSARQGRVVLNGKEYLLNGISGTLTIARDNKLFNNKNSTLELYSRRTSGSAVDNSGTVNYTVESIVVTYNMINIAVHTIPEDGVNQYTEKVYQAGGTKTDDFNKISYSDGKTLPLGYGRVEGKVAHSTKKYSDALNFTIARPSENEVTTQGVAPVEGQNVYLAGWQVGEGNRWSSDIITPDNMNLETIYDKYGPVTSVTIRPVIYPYASFLRFNNSYPNHLQYTNNIKNGASIKVSMMDTFIVNGVGIENSGYAVNGFSARGYRDSNVHNVGSYSAANYLREKNAANVASYLNAREKACNAAKMTAIDTTSADSGRLAFTPQHEAVFFDMNETKPNILVKYNPAGSVPSAYKDKGSVFYFDQDNEENSKSGNYRTEMLLSPIMFGELYDIHAAYTDVTTTPAPTVTSTPAATSTPTATFAPIRSAYKTVWQDFTGDVEKPFGQLSQAEQDQLASYNLDRKPVVTDTFTYIPKATNSMIYYHFEPRAVADADGVIDGTVVLKDYPVFGERKATLTPLNGAAVTVDGVTVSTEKNEYLGGLYGRGGDGYFRVTDKSFVSGEMHRVNIVYGPLSTAAAQSVNVAKQYILDAYDTISVTSASKAKGDALLQESDLIYNDDANYTLTFNTSSSNSALIATKAVLKFYRADGSYITEREYTSTGSLTGIFKCTFNPGQMQLPPGTSITVTFTDNRGTTYFEHETGLSLAEKIGLLTLMTSFAGDAGGAALAVVGTVLSSFDFGWDGNLDDGEGSFTEQGSYTLKTFKDADDGNKTKKQLTVGLTFSSDGETEQDVEAEKTAIKDAASTGTADAMKGVAKDKVNGKSQTSGSVTAGYNMKLNFGIRLTLALSEQPENKGKWYFEEFMFFVTAGAGVSASYSFMTPIGIPVIVGGTVGGEATAAVVVEKNVGPVEYYISKLQTETPDGVDLVHANSLKGNTTTYGKFIVAPYIGVHAGVGVDSFNITLHGNADFNFEFNTQDSNQNSGEVLFTCKLKIKILFFDLSFTLGQGRVDLFEDGMTLYEGLDNFEVSEREYLANRSGWNSGGFDLYAVADLNEMLLMDGVNPNADIQLEKLDEGRYLAVYVDDVPERTNENSTAVFYTVYDGTSWSEPVMFEDDGTTDDSPVICDLENGSLFIAWSTANTTFGEDPAMLDVLNSRNIHGCFFDKTKSEPEAVIEVTRNTDEDVYGDVDAQVVYDSDSGKMLIYYTKSEYEATAGENGVFGDAVYPYSLITYRIYDTNTNEFVGYSAEEEAELKATMTDEEYEAYVENYYGQRFLDLAPTVIVSETLDDFGYSTGEREITEYEGTDPLVIESDAISYNGLSVFAYLLDYDGDKGTTNDRDIFLQIYDFETDTVTHSIMVTSNDVEERGLKLERIGGENGSTFLAYMSEGAINMFDISSNIGKESVTAEGVTENGVPYYYLDKTEASGYVPPIAALSGSGNGDYTGEQEIVDFDIKSDENDFYIMFTESVTKLKEGIDPDSAEAALAENNVIQTDIYAVRYNIASNEMTAPVRVTDEEGTNYANVAFAVDEGGFMALATKSKSSTEAVEQVDADGNVVGIADVSTDGSDNSSLYAMSFTPSANVSLRDAAVENIASGATASGSFEVYNGGLEAIEGLTVEVTDKDGNVIELNAPEETTESGEESGETEQTPETDIDLKGGAFKEIAFAVPVGEESNEAGFKAVVKDAAGEILDTIELTESVPRSADVVIFTADITERGAMEYRAVVRNLNTVTSGDRTFTIKAGDTTLVEETFESLTPNESIEFSGEVEIDYDELFESVIDEDGSVTAESVLTASAGSEELDETLTLWATKEQMERFNAVTDVTFASDGDVEVPQNGMFALAPTVTADTLEIDNNTEEIDALGVSFIYMSDNEDVVKVHDGGIIEGISQGTATVTALLVPVENTYNNNDAYNMYPLLPNEAIKTYTFDVSVTEPVATETPTRRPSSGGGGGGAIMTPTPAPTATPVPTATEDPSATPAPSSTPEPSETTSFIDVADSDWFNSAVNYVADNGIMVGVSNNEFGPYINITRAMFATIIYRLSGETAETLSTQFVDVPEDTWYSEAVAWCASNGIVLGVSDTEFAPDNIITREQMCAMLKRYIDYTGEEYERVNEITFTDADMISEYAAEAVSDMAAYGIINGRDTGEFDPQNGATRAECATVIMNFTNLEAIGGE